MAGEKIYALRYAKHPTVAIDGAAHALIAPGTTSKADQGAAGTTGRAGTLVTDKRVDVEVHAIETIYTLTDISHGAANLSYGLFARLTPRTVFKVDQGAAGSPGPAGVLVTYSELACEIYGQDFAELLALIGATKATLTLSVSGAAGAAQSVAVTNVYFDEIIGQVELPAKDAGGTIAAFGIRGQCAFGAAETFADVITATPTNYEAILAKIGATAANLVLGIEGAAGANEKITVKNVYFHSPVGSLEIPAKDVAGSLQPFGIRGIGLWGAADTFALMVVAASDP